MEFETGGGSLGVSVNGKGVGKVGSKMLSSAFANIYCDGKAVCTMTPSATTARRRRRRAASSPKRGAVIGATVGYALGKVLG